MKTKFYHLLAVTLLLNCINAIAEEGTPFEYVAPVQKMQRIFEGDSNKKNPAKLYPEELSFSGNRAEGQAYGSNFIQDVRVYSISSGKRLAIAYISGHAAVEVGCMGFKVGDMVTWENPKAKTETLKGLDIHQYFTGIIDLLDSDKCYIKINHTNKLAVKPYEDIIKTNP